MKITGVGSGGATSGTRRTDKTAAKGEFKQALFDAMESLEEAHAVEAPATIARVDSLLAVQSMGDATEREARRRLVRRGEDILDKLEEVRRGLILGEVPVEKLESLAQMIRTRRESCADPRLAGLLDEIELRAEVELAKLSRRS